MHSVKSDLVCCYETVQVPFLWRDMFHVLLYALFNYGFSKKGKAIPVTGHRGPWGCETSRLPHFLDNRLTDGGEVFSLTRRPPFTPRNIPGTHFCQRQSRTQNHSTAGRIGLIAKSNYLTGNRTRDLSACSIMPQPTTLPRAPRFR
jgi:hypothetical protein